VRPGESKDAMTTRESTRARMNHQRQTIGAASTHARHMHTHACTYQALLKPLWLPVGTYSNATAAAIKGAPNTMYGRRRPNRDCVRSPR